MAGRPRKPMALREHQGTARADRDYGEMAVEVLKNKLPPAPKSLNDIGKKFWKECVKNLQKSGVLSELDLNNLESYCMYLSWVDMARKKLNNNIENFFDERNGESKINDLVKEMRQWEIRANKIGSEFGFSPQARTKINISPKKEVSPLKARIEAARAAKMKKVS